MLPSLIGFPFQLLVVSRHVGATIWTLAIVKSLNASRVKWLENRGVKYSISVESPYDERARASLVNKNTFVISLMVVFRL